MSSICQANWARFTQEFEDKLSNRPLPSDCQKDENTLRAIILKAASHHIPLEDTSSTLNLCQLRSWI